MSYPTMQEVQNASHEQLGRWSRYLPSPGMSAIDVPARFEDTLAREKKILDYILDRFQELGGWNPELSKRIGWE